MKRVIAIALVGLLVVPTAGCDQKQKESFATAYIETATKTSQLETAKKYMARVKAEMQKTAKDEYFESEEWIAFVDAFWDGYNQGQEMMKNPQYMEADDIEY